MEREYPYLDRLLRISDVKAITGLGNSTIYRRMSDGTFPRPVSLGPQTVRWRERDIISWQESLPVSYGRMSAGRANRESLSR